MNKGTLKAVRAAIAEASEGPPPEFKFGDALSGFSGRRLISCLHKLTGILCGPDRVYLEIGVFQGLTLISNAYMNPKVACFGVDNFSLFNEGRDNYAIVRQRIERLGVTNATIINMDFEEALLGLDRHIGGRKIGVFFVDGAHDYRSQLVSLLKAKPYLADGCAIVIDDSNYGHVRQANADFLRSHPEFALLMEAYTPGHMANLSATDRELAAAGFWNGVNILVHDPAHLVGRSYPREEEKGIYFQSHDVFRHEFAELAFPCLQAIQSALDGDDRDNSAFAEIRVKFSQHRADNSDRFRHQNTLSTGLPTFRLCP